MSNTIVLGTHLPPSIPAEDLSVIQGAFQTLNDKLVPHLADLGPDDRRQLLKMGPRSVDFVSRALGYARAMPQYQPNFVDIEEYQRALDTSSTLTTLMHPLDQIHDMVDDTILLAGSQAYEAALSFYDSLKSAARRGKPDAQMAAADLAERLPARGPSKTPAIVAAANGQGQAGASAS